IAGPSAAAARPLTSQLLSVGAAAHPRVSDREEHAEPLLTRIDGAIVDRVQASSDEGGFFLGVEAVEPLHRLDAGAEGVLYGRRVVGHYRRRGERKLEYIGVRDESSRRIGRA